MGPKTMSDSGDSFEKIEFEQSALAAPPTSDQQSADLTTGDQQSSDLITSDQQSTDVITSDQQSSDKSSATSDLHSADLTTGDQQSGDKSSPTSDKHSADLNTGDQHSSGKSPATTMSSSTTKTVQPEDLEYELAWKTRDEIFGNLNQHTALLSGLIDPDTRAMLKKANGDLMVEVMNLTPQVDDRSKDSQEQPECRRGALNEVVLYLSSDMKSRIVDTLIANHNVLLLGADSISCERKAKLIVQNTDLAYELLKLRVRTGTIPGANASDSSASKEDPRIDPVAKTSESQTTSNSAANEENLDEVAILKEELEQLKDSVASSKEIERDLKEELAASKGELERLEGEVISNKEKVKDLEEKLAESKEELEKFETRMDEVDVGKSEITITSELKGVEALLAGSAEGRDSKSFTCGGMSWYLNAHPLVQDGVSYLAVFLYCTSDLDRWSVVTTYEVRLLSSSSSSGAVGSDVIGTFKDCVFKKPNLVTGWGRNRFITLDKLRSGSFIQDDTIKFRVHLTTKKREVNVDF